MADFQIKEKIKKITEAAKHGDNVPEQSKNAGLVVFLILFGCGIIVMFALAIGLAMNRHWISAAIVFLLAALLTYSIFKMMNADEIRHL